ncbi:MAG: efflux RND transporter permease subunit, partial [Bacteroidota bacterium]|nr:efflux RND transporter permease subunit [Bacteroidota bacterium]
MILAGVFGLTTIKKSFFPETTSRIIVVQVYYPGASPKQMEEGITMRIEEALRSIVGLKEVTSTSSENFTKVNIETTGQYNIDETLMDVKNAVDGITSLPVDAEQPIVFKIRNITPAMFLGLTGDMDLLELKKLADKIEYDFYNSGVMSQINVGGYPALEISVEINQEDLTRYNISFDDISRKIALNNRDISGGQIRNENEEILIRTRNRSVDPEEIGNIVLRANANGGFIRIKDVADLKLQFADVPSNSFMNGKRSISFSIQKIPEEDLDAISEWVNKYTKEFNLSHPNATLEVTYDFLDILQERLALLYNNGGIGLVLVLIMLGLFLSFRLSLWVAWGIPSSFLGMFFITSLYGATINMMSLFGMILVVGILVDDGIVIAENIYAHFESGKSARKAAVDGTMEVLPAVVTSIITTIVAFLPLLFMEGRVEMMSEMAFVVIASLVFSLFEAFFVLPSHIGSEKILRRSVRDNTGTKIRKILDKGLMYLRDTLYSKILTKAIKWRWIALSIPLGFMILTAGLIRGGLIDTTFFPSIPFNQFNADIAFKPGTGEKITLKYLKVIDDAIWEVNEDIKTEYNDTINHIAYSFVSTGAAFNGEEIGSHAGNIFVLLNAMEDAPINSYDIVNRVNKKIDKIPEAIKLTIAGKEHFGDPISISLLGNDLEEVSDASKYLVKEMEKMDPLNNIRDNNALGKREIRLNLKPKAYFLGLDYGSISNQVRQGFFGDQAQRLQKGKDELRVWVRFPKSGRLNVGQLDKMKIKTQAGEFPLSELADFEVERSPVSIKHYNSSREIRIFSGVKNPMEAIPPLLEHIEKNIIPELQAKYPNVDYSTQGQSKDSKDASDQMMKYFSIAFIIILLILMLHFKSLGSALIILMMIPLAWMAAIWGHGIEGKAVSLLSMFGMIALSGVIINDAVVFL